MLVRIYPVFALVFLCLSGCVAEVGDADAEAPAPKPQLTTRQSQNWNGRYYVCGNNQYYCRHPQSRCYFNGSQYRCTQDGLLNTSNGYGNNGYGNNGGGFDNNIYGNNGYGNNGTCQPNGYGGCTPNTGNNGYGNNGYGNNGYGNNGYGNNGYGNNGYGNSCTPNYGNNGYGNNGYGNNGYGNSCTPNYGNNGYGNSCTPNYGNNGYGNSSYGNSCTPNTGNNGYGNGSGLYYGNQTGRYYVCSSRSHYCRNPQSRCYFDGSRYMCSHDGSYGGYNYYNNNGGRWSYSGGKKPPTKTATPDALGRLSFPSCEGDFDCDGVANAIDKCSATLPRDTSKAANLEHVWKKGKWAGCAEGQIRDIGDADRDGVPNSRDRCGQTTVYTLVSATLKLAGCSIAQDANVKVELSQSKITPSATESQGATDANKSAPVSTL